MNQTCLSNLTRSRRCPSWDLSSSRIFLEDLSDWNIQFGKAFKLNGCIVYYYIVGAREGKGRTWLSIRIQFSTLSEIVPPPSVIQEVVNKVTENTELLLLDVRRTHPEIDQVEIRRMPRVVFDHILLDQYLAINTPITQPGWSNVDEYSSWINIEYQTP